MLSMTHHLDFGLSPIAAVAPERLVEGATLTGRVQLDGARFRSCVFRNAVLVYAGSAGTELSDCAFEATRIEFIGPAGNGLAFLKAMSSQRSGMTGLVRASFPQLFGH